MNRSPPSIEGYRFDRVGVPFDVRRADERSARLTETALRSLETELNCFTAGEREMSGAGHQSI